MDALTTSRARRGSIRHTGRPGLPRARDRRGLGQPDHRRRNARSSWSTSRGPRSSRAASWNFFTTSVWNPAVGHFGVLGLLEGTLIIATIAMVLAVPLARRRWRCSSTSTRPPRAHAVLTSMIDLLAALPSLLFGIWGLFASAGPPGRRSRSFLCQSPLGRAVPARSHDGDAVVGSSFIAGVVVAIMITADHHLGDARRHGAGAARAVRRRARARRNALGNDPRRHPAVRAQRDRRRARCSGSGARSARRSRSRSIISPARRRRTRTCSKGGASSIAAYIAIHFGEATLARAQRPRSPPGSRFPPDLPRQLPRAVDRRREGGYERDEQDTEVGDRRSSAACTRAPSPLARHSTSCSRSRRR